MAKVNFKLNRISDKISPQLERVRRELSNLPKEAYNFWVGITPKLSGNARRNTHLSGSTINANYAYARRLDKGYSKQAPKGMSEPTEAFIRKKIKQRLGK